MNSGPSAGGGRRAANGGGCCDLWPIENSFEPFVRDPIQRPPKPDGERNHKVIESLGRADHIEFGELLLSHGHAALPQNLGVLVEALPVPLELGVLACF